MLGFSRHPSSSAWVGCAPEGALAHLACVDRKPGSAPSVRWASTEPWTDATASLRSLRRSRKLSQHRRVGLLQRGQYQLLPMDAPDVPREDWKQALRWQLKDLVDFAVDSAAIDLLELPAGGGGRAQARVLAVAAPQAQVRPLAQWAEDAGTPWQAIDIPEIALRNISALVEPAGRAQALLHFADSGLLVVTQDGELLLSRAIDVSALQLGSEDAEARQQAFDRAGLELQRTLDSFERQFSHLSLARLLVAPGPAMEAFCTYLAEMLYAPVSLLDLGDRLDLSAVAALADPQVLGTHLRAIGAALRGG